MLPDDLRLTAQQRAALDAWLPGALVVEDHSWGLVETTVLELLHGDRRYIAKAAGAQDHHLVRELRAHERWLEPWTSAGRAPALVHADLDINLLVTVYLPGRLVEGAAAELLPDTYRQAGELLAQLHRQLAVPSSDYEARENAKALAWLDREHRIAPAVEERLRDEVWSWPTPETVLVPTHGDWQPRNWLVSEGRVNVIDFGRADLRPGMTDLSRLSAQQFRRSPDLEVAFLDGYGTDPREPGAWYRTRVREAIGTAVWAHQVGDVPFEQQGHRMIAEVLSERS